MNFGAIPTAATSAAAFPPDASNWRRDMRIRSGMEFLPRGQTPPQPRMRDIDGPPHRLSTSFEIRLPQKAARIERVVADPNSSCAAEHVGHAPQNGVNDAK